jgi:hypothetical protein
VFRPEPRREPALQSPPAAKMVAAPPLYPHDAHRPLATRIRWIVSVSETCWSISGDPGGNGWSVRAKPGKFAFPSTPTHTRLARDGKGGSNVQGCASRGHFVRLVGLCRFDLLAGCEPPHGTSHLKLEPHATSALRERAGGQVHGLTHLAHLLRHHQA